MCLIDFIGSWDDFKKTGYNRAVVGLSGGIDSALTATIAADAIGSNHLRSVFLPSKYTSKSSEIDAKELIKRLLLLINQI